MSNTSSFIMRDQVHNLVPSIMQHTTDHSTFKLVGQFSVAIITLAAFRFLLL